MEDVLGYLYRSAADMQRIAEGVGLDPTLLALQGSSPVTAWHSVIALAEGEGKLADLYDMVRKEHPRNAELAAAWDAYQAVRVPATRRRRRPPDGQDGTILSDNYRTDNRIDALNKELSDLKAVVARLESTLTYMISQNNALSEQNKAILRVLDERESAELPHALQWYVAGGVLIVLAVFAIVYLGGRV